MPAPGWRAGLGYRRRCGSQGSASFRTPRANKAVAGGVPLHASLFFFAQGYSGLPINASNYFGPVDYYETAAYLGIIAPVLAGIAVVISWRRPIVIGLGVTAIACVAFIYRLGTHGPIQQLVIKVGLACWRCNGCCRCWRL